MNKRSLIFLFFLAVIVYTFAAIWIELPGYMDAEYYYGQAVHIFQNRSFDEEFIWNYLNNPAGIPVAGFSFWLPFSSILAAMGLFLFGTESFFASRVFFIILAAFIPILAAKISYAISANKRAAVLASGLALFSGLFFPYVTITDTFTPFMVAGGLFFLLVLKINRAKQGNSFFLFLLMGILIGVMSLTRSEGLLWLAGGGLLIFYRKKNQSTTLNGLLKEALLLLIGFVAVMSTWYLRNLLLYGSIFPPGNQLMLWLSSYDDLFVYPSDFLNFKSWIAQGYTPIIFDRLQALGKNLILLITASGFVALAPLALAGYWRFKQKTVVKIFSFLFALILIVMSFIFPYAGSRGGFFHSLSGFQVLICCLIPAGLENWIDWGIKKRKWVSHRAWFMFSILSFLLAVSISIFGYLSKLNNGIEGTPWNQTNQVIIRVEQIIRDETGNSNGIIMVNNPPAYTLYTGRSSVMIPSGGAEAILSVCDRYDVAFLVLDGERADIEELWHDEIKIQKAFELLMQDGNLRIYAYLQQ